VLAVFIATAIALGPQPGRAQAPSPLTGRWTLNRQQSELPAEVGFGLDLVPANDSGTGAPTGGGRGSRRASGGASPWMSGRESPDDAKRVQLLTAEARTPSSFLIITETPTSITLSDDRLQTRTFHPATKQDVFQLGDVPVAATTRREAGAVLVRYQVEQGRELQYSYTLRPSPRQLVVETRFLERGGGDVIRRVYDPLGADDPLPPASVAEPPRVARGVPTAPTPPTPLPGAPATPSSPAAPPPQAPAAPSMVQTPDAELKGLARLGLVVEELSQQAAACGLTPQAIDAAVRQPLVDAGLKVVRDTDDDTYLYVNIITSRMPNGPCVSRYDATLYSHTTAALSFQPSPVLVQVALLHAGGLSGGAPAAHAESVVSSLKQYVTQFATRIRAVNK